MVSTIIFEALFVASLIGIISIVARGIMRLKDGSSKVALTDFKTINVARKSVGEMFDGSMKKFTEISSNHINKTRSIHGTIPSNLKKFSKWFGNTFEENREDILMKKGSASFFLKEIAEHKKKLEKRREL